MLTRRIAALVVAIPVLSVVACGGGDDGAQETAGQSTGSSGAGGANAGGASAAGKGGASTAGKGGASTGGKGGAGGGASGSTQSGGAAGHAGSTGGAAGASGGKSGSGGTAGATGGKSAGGGAGASGGKAGGGGTAGAGGGGCKVDGDCPVPTTLQPAGCAVGKCDATSHACTLVAADKDGDGHGTTKCTDSKGAVVVLGDDCDDGDPQTYPTAWDGPMDATHPDRCDGLDQNCDGKPDDTTAANGATCTCTPNDVTACKEDSSGQPIQYPAGPLQGVCKYGSKTCLSDGTWGPCTDAQGPTPEVCDGLDNDCNGIVDDNPTDPVEWVYDGDNDGHGAIGCDSVFSCVQSPPSQLPTNCPAGPNQPGTCATCTPDSWKQLSAIPADDCNDDDPTVSPTAQEICDGQDNNCDQQIDEGFLLGSACDINGIHVGACLGGGIVACAPDHSGGCYPPTGVTIPGDFSTSAAPNGSWDWNCDGSDQHEYNATWCKHTDLTQCDADEDTICYGLMPPDCGGTYPNGSTLAYFQSQTQSFDACGDQIRTIQCSYKSPTCAPSKGTWVTDRCR